MFKYLLKFLKSKHDVNYGWKIYKRIKKEYGKDTIICVSQHPAIGDSYLVGLYLDNYYKDKKIVVTSISDGSEEIYRYLGIKNVVRLTQVETEKFILFCQFCGIPRTEVNVLHYQALNWHTGILWNFNGVYGLNFAELIENVVFPSSTREDRKYPISNKNCYIEKQLEKCGFKKGKTVIFFPYTNTLIEPPTEVWDKVIAAFRDMDFCLTTYVYKNEPPLPNTKAICSNLDELITISEYAGIVVGVRSGLMDIIGIANCKKIVLYPKCGAESWIHGSIKDFWSIKGFGYCEDVEEYEY